MSYKTEFIKARVTKQTKQLFKQLAKREKISGSKLLRLLLHNYDNPISLSSEDKDNLQHHFTNTARIGGLLNQIAYHLNSKHIDVVNGNSDLVKLDAEKLSETCNKLEKEIQQVKQMLVQLNSEVA